MIIRSDSSSAASEGSETDEEAAEGKDSIVCFPTSVTLALIAIPRSPC